MSPPTAETEPPNLSHQPWQLPKWPMASSRPPWLPLTSASSFLRRGWVGRVNIALWAQLQLLAWGPPQDGGAGKPSSGRSVYHKRSEVSGARLRKALPGSVPTAPCSTCRLGPRGCRAHRRSSPQPALGKKVLETLSHCVATGPTLTLQLQDVSVERAVLRFQRPSFLFGLSDSRPGTHHPWALGSCH